jgi:uncharacterized protein (TIGR03435 family)
MKSRLLCALLVLSAVAAFAQAGDKLAFEVASIKPAPPQPMNQTRIGMQTDGGMLRYTNVAIREMIRVAYKVKDFQIEGPDWMGTTRFDISAKFPAGATEDNVPEMLQALLAERFKLILHKDSQERPVYAMVVGKNGPKLKAAEVQTNAPTDGGANPSAYGATVSTPIGGSSPPVLRPSGQVRRSGAMMMSMAANGMTFNAPSVTIAQLAEALSRFTERPIQDATGIDGQYEFELTFMPETMRGIQRRMPPPAADHPGDAADTPPAESITEALQHYGLKLEPRKSAVDVLTIEHVEKTPTEN